MTVARVRIQAADSRKSLVEISRGANDGGKSSAACPPKVTRHAQAMPKEAAGRVERDESGCDYHVPVEVVLGDCVVAVVFGAHDILDPPRRVLRRIKLAPSPRPTSGVVSSLDACGGLTAVIIITIIIIIIIAAAPAKHQHSSPLVAADDGASRNPPLRRAGAEPWPVPRSIKWKESVCAREGDDETANQDCHSRNSHSPWMEGMTHLRG